MTYIITLVDPPPKGEDIRTLRLVVGGATRNDSGNSLLQIRNTAGTVKTHFGNLPLDVPPDGITITRIPVVIDSNETLDRAAQSTKEQLANFVEKGYAVVTEVGVGALTAAQVRAL